MDATTRLKNGGMTAATYRIGSTGKAIRYFDKNYDCLMPLCIIEGPMIDNLFV